MKPAVRSLFWTFLALSLFPASVALAENSGGIVIQAVYAPLPPASFAPGHP